MIVLSLFAVVLFAICLSGPLTFFTMLFLGNIGIHLGFIDLLPGAIALRLAMTSVSSKE